MEHVESEKERRAVVEAELYEWAKWLSNPESRGRDLAPLGGYAQNYKDADHAMRLIVHGVRHGLLTEAQRALCAYLEFLEGG